MENLKKITLLTISAFTLAGCGGTSVSSHVHAYGDWQYLNKESHVRYCTSCDEDTSGYAEVSEHEWGDAVTTRAATHTSEGLLTYYCKDCGGTKTEVIPATDEHTYDRKVATDEYFAKAATCLEPAQYYYSCVCGVKGSETFSYGPTLEHNITGLSVTSAPVKKEYVAYDEFRTDGLKITYTCSECGTHEADMSQVVIEYANGGTKFRSGDTYVIAHYGNAVVKIDGLTVSKADNYIYGMEDINIVCHQTFTLPKVTSYFGTPTVSVYDKDGNIVSKKEYGQLEEAYSPYEIRATVPEDDEYPEVTAVGHIYVEHEIKYNSGKHADVCICGTYALNNYYYDLSSGSVFSGDVSGTMGDKFNDSLDVYDVNTGKAPNFEGVAAGDVLDFAVRIDGEEVHLPCLVGDRVVTTLDEINQYVRYSKENYDNKGYFILGADINVGGEVVDYAESDFDFNEKIGDTSDTYGWTRWANHSFMGTFDGRGHEISKIRLVNYGFLGCIGSGAKVKNFRMTHLYTGDSTTEGGLAYTMYNSEISDVYMQYDYVADVSSGALAKSGLVIAYMLGNYAKQSNVVLDCAGLDIGVAYSGMMLGYGTQWPLSYTNCEVICRSYKALGYSDYGRTTAFTTKVDGVTITLK